MILKKLSVLNYKNILQSEVIFSPKMNCFFGNNGMGKTNLLDAIHYLSFCKSHVNTPDSQIINSDQDLCVVQGNYDYEGREEEIFCAMRRRQRKQFKRNKKEYDKLSEHIGLLPLVMVSPADADLIRGGTDERRRFLDLIISQQDKPYLHALIQYNKALLQRNTLLKDQSMDASLYEVLEMQLGMYGQIVYEKRKKLVEDFTPIFNETTPILLLDDIFDKLDASRVEQIIKLVSENGFGQIFITDTNRKYLDEILLAMNHDYALFRVERGEVQPMEE